MRSFRPLVPLVAVALALSLGARAQAAPRAITPEDMVTLAGPGDLALSPDGRLAAFALARAERDTSAKPSANDTNGGWTRTRQIVLLDLATRATRTLTAGPDRAGAPRFSPDGRTLAFTRKGALWLLPLAGGEAKKLDTGTLEPGSPRWLPDGRGLAFLAEPAPTDAETEAKWRSGGAIAWDREWRPTRLWTVSADGGTPRAITPDSLHVVEFDVSPDGGRFVVTTSRSSDPYESFGMLSVRAFHADGRGIATMPDADTRWGHPYRQPRWTPDGRTVVVIGLTDGLSNMNQIFAWDPAAGAVRALAPGKDHTFESYALVDGGRTVLANTSVRTETRLLRLPLAGGTPQDAGFAGRAIGSEPLTDAAGRRVLFLSSTPRDPQDVTAFDLATKRVDVLTTLNPQVADWARGETQIVRWTCPEGVALEGLLTRSPGASGATPLIVLPHGGPDETSRQSFSAQVQCFASHGYAVFRPNYRGGTAYGFDFYAANRNRFGEIEQMDIESGVDALIAKGLVDPAKLFYGGWSWGGYLTAWTIGHVQRYKAAVVGAGVNDATYSYSSSDINHGLGAQWEYKGDPWRQTEHFDRANPIRSAKDMRTPTLILHGQADDRVHFMNGVILYRALADVGAEVKFFAYPREPHGFAEPAHNVHRMTEWLKWYDTHGGAGVARP